VIAAVQKQNATLLRHTTTIYLHPNIADTAGAGPGRCRAN